MKVAVAGLAEGRPPRARLLERWLALQESTRRAGLDRAARSDPERPAAPAPVRSAAA